MTLPFLFYRHRATTVAPQHCLHSPLATRVLLINDYRVLKQKCSMSKILVVDDELDLCEILRFDLSNEGFDVTTCSSAEEALVRLSSDPSSFDLILLDVMMEHMSGFDMARHLRSSGNDTPIIFLTARDSHDDQLAGFDCGADDYITKPFSFDTVLARVKAVLKRTAHPTPKDNPPSDHLFHSGSLSIDMSQGNVTANGKNVVLTRREFMILRLMAEKPNHYFSREEIMVAVWPNDALVNDRSVDVHIARLRKKLGSEGRRITNRTGFGYALTTDD